MTTQSGRAARINDGVAMLLFLPWFSVAFFCKPDWRDARISKPGGMGWVKKGPGER
jgi:hypothetical protein